MRKETLRTWEDWRRVEKDATEKKWQELQRELIRELNISCYEAICNSQPELEFEFDLSVRRDLESKFVVIGTCRNCGKETSGFGVTLPGEYEEFVEYYFEGKNPTLQELKDQRQLERPVFQKFDLLSSLQPRLPTV